VSSACDALHGSAVQCLCAHCSMYGIGGPCGANQGAVRYYILKHTVANAASRSQLAL
jgi:hypothetical protein